jgi:3-methyladenine DNA glycosylase AlkD
LIRDASGERLLLKLADAESMWERRLAVLLTFAFIRAGDFGPTLIVADQLLGDKQDLMHKAVGWMLREVGKRDADVLRTYLNTHIRELPRTSLRYAIEKFDEPERKAWLTR